MSPAAIWKRWVDLFEEREDPAEPHYDPAHLAVVLVTCLVVVGALFWLLWTLFLYEGGLPRKIAALAVRLTDPRAHDRMLLDSGVFGGPGHENVFDGWAANVAALAIAAGVVALLERADRLARRRK